MMRVVNGRYLKDNGEIRNIELLILEDGPDFLKGIDLTILNEMAKEKILKINKEYENKLSPYIKTAFRHFKKNKLDFS